MELVEVDRVDAKPAQARIAGTADVFGPPVVRARGRIGRPDDAELRREDDLVAVPGERFAEEQLVRADAVHVRGVEQGDAELERPVDRPHGLDLVGRTVELGHPHAAEPERRDGEAASSQLTLLHGESLPSDDRTGPEKPYACRLAVR